MSQSVQQSVPVALIGCGAVSEILYAPALKKLAGEGLTETVALVDPNPTRRSKISEMIGSGQGYENLPAMVAMTKPGLAIVAAPHSLHEELVVSCLGHGIPVLCEKPMATTTAECDRMIDAARQANRLLAVGHFRRFFPSTQMIKRLLDSGLLGPVRSFRFLEGEVYSWPAQSLSFFKRAQAGGGVLIDAGAHTLDLLLWWLGEVAEFTYEDDAMGGVEANCRLRLTMKSGPTGLVQLSRDWPLPNRYVINCEKGWLTYICDVVDRIEWGLHDWDFGLDSTLRQIPGLDARLGNPVPDFMDCFVNQLRNLVAAVQGVEPLRVSGAEARKAVALIEDCYRTRRLLNMPWLAEAELSKAKELAHV